MKKFVAAVFFLVPTLALAALGVEEGKVAKGTVVVPQDTTPFSVEINETVRLTGQGISGSLIVAHLKGPATIVDENSIITVQGGQPVIGMEYEEYDIKPTGRGKVTVTITSTPPDGAEPTVTTYEFVVH